MKTTILLFVTVLFLNSMTLTDEKYYQKMGETLQKFASATSVEDYQELANTFGTIASVDTAEWLPLYYETQCYILMSFVESTDAGKKDAYLDRAKEPLERMLVLGPEESEVHALVAFYYTARMVVNPMERAQYTSSLIYASISRSLKLDPSNPRARYIRLSNEIGTAQFFGNDISPYCETARELLDSWDSYEVRSPIHPVWGKNQVLQILDACDN